MSADKTKGVGAPKSEWIDISYPLSDDMVHLPTDPLPPHIDWMLDYDEKGSWAAQISLIINTRHGTHIDTPRRFSEKDIPDNRTSIDQMPLDAIIGPARVIEIKNPVSIEPEDLEPYNIQAGERILFKTINSSYYKRRKFVENYVYVSTRAASFLKDKKVSVVGLDYLDIGGPFKDTESLRKVHITLLSNGIWILEAIDLSGVEAGQYEIFCLPLRIMDGDAGLARAVLRPFPH